MVKREGMADRIDAGEEGPVRLTVGKPRLKWTPQLHDHFVLAVTRVGGPDKATPRSLLQEMKIPGLTVHHLKSHLQKHRLAISRDSAANNKKEDVIAATEGITARGNDKISHLQLSETMLKKLEERIEVQKRLQLRIEAEGKYLQSLLRKAQETIASYSSSDVEVDEANAEIKELVSAVENADSAADSCLTSMYELELKSKKSVEIDPMGRMQGTGRVLGVREEIDLNK